MRKIHVREKSVVLVLSKIEAKALQDRLLQNTEIERTKPVARVIDKLANELDGYPD